MKNLQAFLNMVAVSELGEELIAASDRGYNVIVGSRPTQAILFSSYADHPRLEVRVRRDRPATPADEELVSTAAGRYQILARIFDAYRKPLGLLDFGPASQDAIAVQLIRERDGLIHIGAGHFEKAVARVCGAWASLPGAGYEQHENEMAHLRDVYVKAGGTLAA